jgi:hypothetical protein
MRPLTILGIALSLVISANAQSPNDSPQTKCKVRFAVYQSNPHIPGGMASGMSKEQGKWYEKNKTRYPAICLDSDKPDYLLVWSSRFSSEGQPEPVIIGGTVAAPMESEYVYVSIFKATDFQRSQQDKSYKPIPVYYTQHDSWWTYRKSHQKAMEDALKFLADESKK